jgi:hypothetical protein
VTLDSFFGAAARVVAHQVQNAPVAFRMGFRCSGQKRQFVCADQRMMPLHPHVHSLPPNQNETASKPG